MIPPFPDRPFTSGDALALGISRKRLRLALDQGLVRRVFTGAYVRADVPDSTELRAEAAALVMSKHSVLCDRTAAWIHGISVLRYAELDVIPPLETYVLRGHDPTDRHNCNGGSRDLLPEDWQIIGGVRVTTPLRTALDLACKLPRRQATAALDAFAREHHVTVADLRRLLVRYFRRRGVVQARELSHSPTAGSSRPASRGSSSRSTITPCLSPSRSGGSWSMACRRTASISRTHTPGSWSSTTARSFTPRRSRRRRTRRGETGYGVTGGGSSW
jgi:hypothetical protein